jgi:hypothetical protein
VSGIPELSAKRTTTSRTLNGVSRARFDLTGARELGIAHCAYVGVVIYAEMTNYTGQDRELRRSRASVRESVSRGVEPISADMMCALRRRIRPECWS